MCISHLWAELIALGLPQAELCQSDLHGVDDGEAAVSELVWHHHGEAALWTLRHYVTGFTHKHTHTYTHTHRRGEVLSSPSPEKLITETSCHKFDIIKADCRAGTQLGLSMEIQFQF